jgi:hypothetical protein
MENAIVPLLNVFLHSFRSGHLNVTLSTAKALRSIYSLTDLTNLAVIQVILQ